MKHRIAVLILFISFAPFAFAQQKIIDSLEQQLLNPTNGNTKAENLNKLSYYYSRSDPDKGLKKADEAMMLAQKNKEVFQVGVANEYKGFNHKALGNDSIALEFYATAGSIYKALDSIRPLAILSLNKGIFQRQRGKNNEAIENFQTAVESFAKDKDSLLLGYSLGCIGYSHTQLGNYAVAMDSFLKGATLLEQSNNEKTMYYGSIMGDLGVLHQKLEKFEMALSYHNQCLSIYKENDYQRGIASQLNDIATIYSKQKEYEKALETYFAAYEIKKKIKNTRDIANALGNIGITYSKLNQLSQATMYLDSALVLETELNDNIRLASIYESFGDISLLKNEIPKAEQYYNKGVFYAEKANSRKQVYLGKMGLSKSLSEKKDYKAAYKVLNEAITLNESLTSDDKKEEIATLKAQYEYDKEKAVLQANFEKDKAIDQAKIEQQVLVRNTAIGGGILGMAVIVIGFVLTRRKREAELNTKIVTSQLQTLKAQLSPHFIFNTLNSINDYIQNNQRDVASTYLTRFSKMMRKILENSTEEEIPLSEEIDFLENYIKLEQERLENKFSYSITVDKEIDVKETLIPPGLLQPFVENSIWHGLSERKGSDGMLKISAEKNHHSMIINLDDNGVGMDVSKQSKEGNQKSFGTTGVIDRLHLLNKLKGNLSAKVQFIDKTEGVCVQIQLPLIIDSDI